MTRLRNYGEEKARKTGQDVVLQEDDPPCIVSKRGGENSLKPKERKRHLFLIKVEREQIYKPDIKTFQRGKKRGYSSRVTLGKGEEKGDASRGRKRGGKADTCLGERVETLAQVA